MTQHDPTPTTPSYRRQKRKNGSDLAFVEIGGKRHYLGPYNSPESMEAYQRTIAEWRANGGTVTGEPRALTVMELCARFLEHAERYYRGPNGEPTKEYENHLPTIKMLRTVCGRKRVADFTPRDLKSVRQKMIDAGWSRRHINRQVGRLRSVFKWGVAEGLVPVEVHQALGTLAGLRKGRTDATETGPIHPVPKEQVKAVLPHVSRVVRSMILLQWYTGMRPGELVIMRPIDIDMAGKVWLYRPSHHKTEHHDRERVIPLGPKARKIVQRYLGDRPVHAFLFSPRESARQHRAKRHAARKTAASCGNKPGSNRKADPARAPGERYSPATYARAVAYGCQAAWPHPEISKIVTHRRTPEQQEELKQWNAEHRWSPNQLRHAAATRIRKVAGLEMARVVLGHSTMAVTETYYAEADLDKAAQLMAKIG